MIVVTGGAGFIGSNLAHALNARGRDDLLIVDNLDRGAKQLNLRNYNYAAYLHKSEFLERIKNQTLEPATPEIIFHLGACSDTTLRDGQYMMRNNYQYSRTLLDYCVTRDIPFVYASSAAVYGVGAEFAEVPGNEAPINIYGYSKYLFDEYVRTVRSQTQIVGLRYFNVYGPREQHKGAMASVAYHLNEQLKEADTVRLFAGSDGYSDGEQRRDFVYVDDAVAATLWFADMPHQSGIFNVGTGRSASFNDVAAAVLAWHGRGTIQYVPFPDHLKGSYQSFTQADLTALRALGHPVIGRSVQQGILQYLDWLQQL